MDSRDLHELRLDEMDEQEAFHFLTELLSKLDPKEEYAARHEDYLLEIPQSGERIRGRENMRAFQRSYSSLSPSEPTRRVRVRRVLVKKDLWVVEGIADYPEGRTLDVIMISELREGKMWRDRWYFAGPFDAPAWRAQWVERIGTGAAQG